MNLDHFQNLKTIFEIQKNKVSVDMYCFEVEKVYNEFERRFEDIQKSESIIRIKFMYFTFSEANDINDIPI
jgi:hypothetical protein